MAKSNGYTRKVQDGTAGDTSWEVVTESWTGGRAVVSMSIAGVHAADCGIITKGRTATAGNIAILMTIEAKHLAAFTTGFAVFAAAIDTLTNGGR